MKKTPLDATKKNLYNKIWKIRDSVFVSYCNVKPIRFLNVYLDLAILDSNYYVHQEIRFCFNLHLTVPWNFLSYLKNLLLWDGYFLETTLKSRGQPDNYFTSWGKLQVCAKALKKILEVSDWLDKQMVGIVYSFWGPASPKKLLFV